MAAQLRAGALRRSGPTHPGTAGAAAYRIPSAIILAFLQRQPSPGDARATAGKPAMFYVYVIRSLSHPKRYYIGFTENIDQRVKEHNEGKSLHTAKYGPWELAVYLAVPSKTKALDLERYLKSGSGRSFLQRHFL